MSRACHWDDRLARCEDRRLWGGSVFAVIAVCNGIYTGLLVLGLEAPELVATRCHGLDILRLDRGALATRCIS